MPLQHTLIFLDSGSAEHTRIAKEKIGFLDGQTTNPTYFVKSNPEILKAVEAGKKFRRDELFAQYRKLAEEISPLVPDDGSVSLEVYAEEYSTKQDLLDQANEMNQWIPNDHIKLPIIPVGLETAEVLVQEGIRVNMTLCFDQEQGAAVHCATRGAKPGQVFLSPFVSRLDKIGKNGFDILLNIQKMFQENKSHVSILAASVHSIYDIANIIEHEMDVITIPFEDVAPWVDAGMPTSTSGLEAKDMSRLVRMKYKELDLSLDWRSFNIHHDLTNKGLRAFVDDWNSVLG